MSISTFGHDAKGACGTGANGDLVGRFTQEEFHAKGFHAEDFHATGTKGTEGLSCF